MAKEIIQETGKDVGDFMSEFTQTFIMTLVNSKINGAIGDAISEVLPDVVSSDGDDDGGAVEEKELADKEDCQVIAAGVLLSGYKTGWGPDRIYHRYYDLACFAIKPVDSVIAKITYRHRQLINFAAKLKKGNPEANIPFPTKKRFGKKDSVYYRERFINMQQYYGTLVKKQDICTSDEFLKFFRLKHDEAAEERRELFFAALEAQCEKSDISWDDAYSQAERLGLDKFEVEMLKAVAIAKVGKEARDKIHNEIHTNTPGFVPDSVKSRFVNKIDTKLAGIIATTVETAWTGAKEAFAKAADTIIAALEKATEPLKELFVKVMTPVKNLIDEKIKKPETKEDPLDTKLQNVGLARFPPVVAAIDGLKNGNGSCESLCKTLMNAVCDLNSTHKYVPYIQYNCGNPDILEWFPPIENIAEKHQRLTVALIDVCYVLSRGMCRAFMPLCKYVDEASSNFDEKSHESRMKNAVLEGGQKLALDYFSLPSTTWRATWWCGHRVTKLVMKFCQNTVNKQADLLGSIAANWKPTSSGDARATFAAAFETAVTEFLNDRVWTIVSLVRETALKMIANLFESIVGPAIEKIASTLDALVSKLPSPLCDLKPGDIVTNILLGMVEKISLMAVKMWSTPTEKFMAGIEEPEPWDEALAKKFRVAPRIRNDDDDLAKEESDEDDAAGNEATATES